MARHFHTERRVFGRRDRDLPDAQAERERAARCGALQGLETYTGFGGYGGAVAAGRLGGPAHGLDPAPQRALAPHHILGAAQFAAPRGERRHGLERNVVVEIVFSASRGWGLIEFLPGRRGYARTPLGTPAPAATAAAG